MNNKIQKLKEYFISLGSVVVAFSGGGDSTFLLKVAHDTLGDKVLAITANAAFLPNRELNEAIEFCNKEGIRHIIHNIDESQIDGFYQNSKKRCYFCKKAIFTCITKIAHENDIEYVVEGTNIDDLEDYRPGFQAILELGIKSPLIETKINKNEIRHYSKQLGLSTYKKPSFACLASRFPYGETITRLKLVMVEKAEQFLIDKGFSQIRVRIHDKVARIEIMPEEFNKLISIHDEIVVKLKNYGFTYVSMDLQGYRTGSMNEVLKRK